MTFMLQGNARSLRFEGEAKSLSTPSSPGALGKPRVRKPPPAPRAPAPQPTTRMGEAPVRAPFPHRIPTPIAGLHEARRGFARSADEGFGDDAPTMARERDERDALPPAPAYVPPKPVPAAGRSVPHFHGAAVPAAPSVVVSASAAAETTPTRTASRPGAAWFAWIAAAMILGLVSFKVSPLLLGKAAAPPPAHASVSPKAR